MLLNNNFDRWYNASMNGQLCRGYLKSIFRLDVVGPMSFMKASGGSQVQNYCYVQFGQLTERLDSIMGFAQSNSSYISITPLSHSAFQSSGGSDPYYYIRGLGGGPFIMFGTGTTPPTKNDTDLEEHISSVTASTSIERFKQLSNGVLTIDTKMSISNNDTVNDLVFQEFGLFIPCSQYCEALYNTTNSSGVGTQNFTLAMIARHVFDEPITIPSTERKTIVFRATHQIGSSTDYPDISRSLINA